MTSGDVEQVYLSRVVAAQGKIENFAQFTNWR